MDNEEKRLADGTAELSPPSGCDNERPSDAKKYPPKNDAPSASFDSQEDTVIPLTEDEIVFIKNTREGEDRSKLPPYDNSDLSKAKRFIGANKASSFLVFSVVLVLIAVVATLCVMLYRDIKSRPSQDDFTVIIGTDKEYSIPYKEAMVQDVLYFDLCEIAEYAGLVVSGDPLGEHSASLKLLCPDGTYVRFSQNSNVAFVNGVGVLVGGEAKLGAEDSKVFCRVPLDFVSRLFSYQGSQSSPGMRVILDTASNSITIRRVVYSKTLEPLPISFSADCFELSNSSLKDGNTPAELLLVNHRHPLPASFVPQDLVDLSSIGCPVASGRSFSLTSSAALAATDMLTDLERTLGKEKSAYVTSAYRSYEYQSALHEKYVAQAMESGLSHVHAVALVSRTSALPGNSEHQSGLCIDLLPFGAYSLSRSFSQTPAFRWLSDNAHKYGFILRYPESKESITGYDYEPWHFRYVGRVAATMIYEDSICLEEFLAAF